MRIYYNEFSTITRYAFPKDMEALGEISLTPEPILLNSLVCYYEDLEEGKSFRGDFKNPKIYKQYLYEICEKYKDSYRGRRLYNREIGEEVLLDNKWIPVPDDFYDAIIKTSAATRGTTPAWEWVKLNTLGTKVG